MNNNAMPRPEYPKPQFARSAWMNLNGEWRYATDRGNSGIERNFMNGKELCEKIIVPFCRESELSGIGDKDFCSTVWYGREVTLPDTWTDGESKVILNIGACDFKTDVWVNEIHVGSHKGGYSTFSFDVTDALKAGEKNLIVIRAEDHTASPRQASGKQSPHYHSVACFYTRTTGIWQTVWLERVPVNYMTGAKYYPDINNSSLRAEVFANGNGMTVTARALYEGRVVGEASAVVKNGTANLSIALSELHLWEVGEGRLYDLELSMGDDKVNSYFGMREIDLHDGMMYLNGKPIFQRLVLDQGFYPDGIYTAPTLEALRHDVDMSIDMGFNGARLHEKVFEPLFLEYCDRRGYIVWGEHANWSMSHSDDSAYSEFMVEWLEIMQRDFNHPAIVGWCPLNETPGDSEYRFVKALRDLTKAYDSTRLFIDSSGWTHMEGLSDIYDIHDYTQEPEEFKKRVDRAKDGERVGAHEVYSKDDREFTMYPTFVSEYGGTWWSDPDKEGWGYGNSPKTEEEFKSRFKGLTEAIMFSPHMGALCYTQLTDVEQEQNGLYTYDRKPKFDPEFFRNILTQTAEIEKKQ